MNLLDLPNDILDKIGDWVIYTEMNHSDAKSFPLVCKEFRDIWKRIEAHENVFWDLLFEDKFYIYFDKLLRKNDVKEVKRCLEYIQTALRTAFDIYDDIDENLIKVYYRHVLYMLKHGTGELISHLHENHVINVKYIELHLAIIHQDDDFRHYYYNHIRRVNKILKRNNIPCIIAPLEERLITYNSSY